MWVFLLLTFNFTLIHFYSLYHQTDILRQEPWSSVANFSQNTIVKHSSIKISELFIKRRYCYSSVVECRSIVQLYRCYCLFERLIELLYLSSLYSTLISIASKIIPVSSRELPKEYALSFNLWSFFLFKYINIYILVLCLIILLLKLCCLSLFLSGIWNKFNIQ